MASKREKKINICIIPTENYIEYDKARNLHNNIMSEINGMGFYLVFIVKGIMSALGMLYICLLDQRLKITIHREGSSSTVPRWIIFFFNCIKEVRIDVTFFMHLID